MLSAFISSRRSYPAVPGFSKDDIKIDIENDCLTISAERKFDDEDKKKNFVKRERFYGSYSRSFDVTGIDTEAVNAAMDYRYPAGAVRRLDDALLAIYGPEYIALEGNSHRVKLLETRLGRLHQES